MAARDRPAPRPSDGAFADARGAVMLEFLLAFVPVFVLFLGLLQLVLLGVADLVVRHAAITGVRAAVVVLYDDPAYYRGSAQGDARDLQRGESRIEAIHTAVQAPLAALAPRGAAAGSLPPGRTEFARAATAITFPSAPGATELLEDLAQAETITVRVTRLVPCAVPLAGWLLCKRPHWSARDKRLAFARESEPARQALEELKHARGAKVQRRLATGAVPLALLQAEASMAAQVAPYLYPSERTESGPHASR